MAVLACSRGTRALGAGSLGSAQRGLALHRVQRALSSRTPGVLSAQVAQEVRVRAEAIHRYAARSAPAHFAVAADPRRPFLALIAPTRPYLVRAYPCSTPRPA